MTVESPKSPNGASVTVLREVNELKPFSYTQRKSPPTLTVCAPRTQLRLSPQLQVPFLRHWPLLSTNFRQPKPAISGSEKSRGRPYWSVAPTFSTFRPPQLNGLSLLLKANFN